MMDFMKKINLKRIGIISIIIVVFCVVLFLFFQFFSPIAMNHSVKTYLNSDAIDLVYYEVAEFEYDHKVAFDFMNIPNGYLRAEITGTVNFIVPMEKASVKTVEDKVIVALNEIIYKGFEVHDYDYTERTFVKMNVGAANWADGNEAMTEELNEYMKQTYLRDNEDRIKANIAKKIQNQLHEKFPQFTIEVEWGNQNKSLVKSEKEPT